MQHMLIGSSAGLARAGSHMAMHHTVTCDERRYINTSTWHMLTCVVQVQCLIHVGPVRVMPQSCSLVCLDRALQLSSRCTVASCMQRAHWGHASAGAGRRVHDLFVTSAQLRSVAFGWTSRPAFEPCSISCMQLPMWIHQVYVGRRLQRQVCSS